MMTILTMTTYLLLTASFWFGLVVCSPKHHARKRDSGACNVDHGMHSRPFAEWTLNGDEASNHLALLQPPNMEPLKLREDDLVLQPLLLGDKNSSNCQNIPVVNTQPGQITLMDSALCPWYWRMNYDPIRIPAAIPEAHCRCPSSVTGERLFACEEVNIRLRVLVFDSECAELRPDTIEIAVSCVSVMQPMQRLGNIDGVRQHHSPHNVINEVKKK